MNEQDNNFQAAHAIAGSGPGSEQISPEMKQKIADQILKYEGKVPPRYIKFTIVHRCFWLWLNFFNILTSVAMAAGWVVIAGREREQNTLSYQECQSMGVVCWALFTLHLCNCIFSLFALCGLEKLLCTSHVLLALVLYDGIVLVWSQAVYFKSQNYNCNLEMGDVYFWLMGEILFVYCLAAFVICYFFRKFC